MLMSRGKARPENEYETVASIGDIWVVQRCLKPRLWWRPNYVNPHGHWLKCVDYHVYSRVDQSMHANFQLTYVNDGIGDGYVMPYVAGRPTPTEAKLVSRQPRIAARVEVLILQTEVRP